MGALKITGQSAEPTVTASDAGTLYYDSDTNKLRHYNGTAWADVSPAAAALTSAGLPAGSVLQMVQSSNDLAVVSSIVSTSFLQSDSVPYVDITPKAANSKFHMFGKMYGTWNSAIPVLAFAVSTTAGHADSTYTHQIGSSDQHYGSWFTWAQIAGELTVFFEEWYQSSFTAGQTPIRFAIDYKNIYHSSAQVSYSMCSGDDNAAHLIVYEIAT